MALLAKLRPCGPWRVGPDSGDRLRVGRVLHSDALYSALTHAFIPLGELDAWLEATALHADGAQVRLSSCFPFVGTENGDALFLPPPDSHWPPPDSLRIRWESARYITPTAIWQLLSGKPLVEEHWAVDGVSECLLPVVRNVPAPSPFRVAVRSRAAVDRMGQGVEPHQTACLEFSKGAGIWIAFNFASQEAEARWSPALKGALKLIADSGLGGERSSGWGRFEQPEFLEGELGQLLFGNRYRAPEEVTGHWLLSLFSPAADDRVDWQQGHYRVVSRTGRVESSEGWGASKRANQMIAEGGVLVASAPPKGAARDVAPIGFPHPVYRAGFALTIPIGKAKPQPPKPVVVDKALVESLSLPSEPQPSGSGPLPPEDPSANPIVHPGQEPPLPSEPRPSGSGPLPAEDPSANPIVHPGQESPQPSEPRPSGSGPLPPEDPSANPIVHPEPEPPPSEPRPSGSGPLSPEDPSANPIVHPDQEPPQPSEPRPSGSGPSDEPVAESLPPADVPAESPGQHSGPLFDSRVSEAVPTAQAEAPDHPETAAHPKPEAE